MDEEASQRAEVEPTPGTKLTHGRPQRKPELAYEPWRLRRKLPGSLDVEQSDDAVVRGQRHGELARDAGKDRDEVGVVGHRLDELRRFEAHRAAGHALLDRHAVGDDRVAALAYGPETTMLEHEGGDKGAVESLVELVQGRLDGSTRGFSAARAGDAAVARVRESGSSNAATIGRRRGLGPHDP